MKKIIVGFTIGVLLAIAVLGASGCDGTTSTTSNYTYAYIALPNGQCVEGEVEDYNRWSESTVRVTIDGVTYLTHSMNVVFSTEKPE